ncbi:hypothetical protein JCM10213_003851 [Rhodosporidiobolus nylandii]
MAQRFKPQTVDQQVVTHQSSLQQVKALLDAGIGCITYLRGLFPEEAFDDHKLLAPRPPLSRSSTATDDAKAGDDAPSSVRVKKLKRGSSGEVDKLLDWLDKGATEAIEKGYLQQLIFAIYLDPNDPTNIVETYSFTFSYEMDAQGNKRPELVVQNQLSGMVISASSFSNPEAPRKVGDVKRQVQQMIKNLITSTQLLDELPRRRFLTIRLFYTDDTPAEYEPPFFKPVPTDAPKFTIATPLVSEPPDFGTLGALQTGYHGVALHSVSIAHLLDVPYDENISLEEALSRNQRDAASRSVIWDADSLAKRVTDDDLKAVSPEPLGVKDANGSLFSLEQLKATESEAMEKLRKQVGIEVDEEMFVQARGELEETLFESNLSDNENLRRAIDAADLRLPPRNGEPPTQFDPAISRQRSHRPPVPFFDETNEQYAVRTGNSQPGPSKAGSSQLAKVVEQEDEAGRSASPPADTQLLEYSQASAGHDRPFVDSSGPEPDTIKTISQPLAGVSSMQMRSKRAAPATGSTQAAPTRRRSRRHSKAGDDVCECGDGEEDGDMIQCGSCDVWKHAVCYGFTSDKDARIPDDFVCYHCRAQRVHDGSMFGEERAEEIEEGLAGLKTLAMFRRAISVIWQEGVLSMKELAARLGTDNATAAQMLKRLEKEEFVYEQVPVARRLKGKNGSQIGSHKKGPLVVDKTAKQKKRKGEYFDPGRGHELAYSLKLGDAVADDGVETNHKGATSDADPSSPAMPALASAKRDAAVLVEETPSPAAQQLSTKPSASAHALPLSKPFDTSMSMDEDDPILGSESQHQLAFSTPQDTIAPDSAAEKSETAPRQPEQAPPKPSYVPVFGKGKAKAKEVEKKQDEPCHRASSFQQTSGRDEMDVDQPAQQPFDATSSRPHAGNGKGKGRTSVEADLDSALETSTRVKRKKVSEPGGGIEV